MLEADLRCYGCSADHQIPSYYNDYEHYHAQQEANAAAVAAEALNAAAQQHVAAGMQAVQEQQQLEQELPTGDHLAPLLLVTTVDIGDGKADRIEVRQGDVPLEVANAFVSKHGLPTAVVPRLAMHLEENLLKVEAQRRAAVSGVLAPSTCSSRRSCCAVEEHSVRLTAAAVTVHASTVCTGVTAVNGAPACSVLIAWLRMLLPCAGCWVRG